jgi:hypothetical protein
VIWLGSWFLLQISGGDQKDGILAAKLLTEFRKDVHRVMLTAFAVRNIDTIQLDGDNVGGISRV